MRIAARTASGQAPPAGSEVALAAVDEGLLELAGNPSWNLLEAMMRRRSYAVETATAQMQVVGKRHYGLKALPQGGGGGRQPTRELFDTLLLWQARVPLDADGDGDGGGAAQRLAHRVSHRGGGHGRARRSSAPARPPSGRRRT